MARSAADRPAEAGVADDPKSDGAQAADPVLQAASSPGTERAAGRLHGGSQPAASSPAMTAQARERKASEEPKTDRYEFAEVVESREMPSRGGERIRRLRLVRTNFKHPLLRLDEELEKVNGELRVVKQTAAVADHVLLKAADGVTEERLLAALKPLGAVIREKKRASGIWLVSFASPTIDTVPQAVAEITRLGLARYAEPDYVVHANVLPNDASFSLLWGMHNTGQSGGTVDADIDAPEAWDLTTGSRSVLVGVIDTGIDHTHPDLAANMWTNAGEIAGNGIDDDSNGYIDDTRGWDFVNNDNNPIDDNNHGTHCSGTIGGAGNNATGVAGVNWQVSLVGLKFLSASGSGAISDAVEATAYGTDIGVTMTSNSWGGGGFSQAMKDAIDAADAAGILFVAAAGNDSSNSDSITNYPSGYTSPNIIAVASTTRTDGLSSFSNYGLTTVDLGAPGSEIYSTTIGSAYDTFNGTSMATPHVAGACALLKAYRPTLTHSEIKSLIMQSADVIPSLAGKCVSGGRLNVFNAMLFSSDITITPGGSLAASGQVGGPFAPSSISYILTNRASTAATWTAAANQTWVTLSSTGGVLPAGGAATLTVNLDSTAASQLEGGLHQATVTISNLTTSRSQTRAVTVNVQPPVFASQPLDTNPGWTTQGQWAFGQPLGLSGDPSAAKTGTNVYGYNLAGAYTDSMPVYSLTSTAFDCTNKKNIKLGFWRWLGVESSSFDQATVQVSRNNSTWTTVWSHSGSSFSDASWTYVEYDISAVADGQPTVYFRWLMGPTDSSVVYGGWNIDDIVLRGADVKNIGLTLASSATEGDGPVTATLTITPPATAGQVITIGSDKPEQATAPASLTLAAGATTAAFPVTITDDTLADGTQTVTVTAGSSGFQDKSAAIDIHDNETRTLTLALPATVAEGAGAITGQASVGLNAAADTDVRVVLTSSDATELQAPASVIIPAGQTTVLVTLTAPDDSLIDGQQSTLITAAVQNWTAASGTVNVTDNEALTLSLTLPAALLEGQGGAAPVGSVVLTGIATAAVEVSLSSDDVTELTVPATVTILAGQSSGPFPVTILNDGIADGSQTVNITATAAGFFSDGTGQIIVHDADTPAGPTSPQPAAGAPEVHPDSNLAWSYAAGTGGVPENYDVYFGTNPSPGAAELVASAVAAPSHAMSRLGLNTTYFWKIISRKGTVTTSGPVWSFTVPPAGNPVRFVWDTISSPKQADVPFAASITAYDAFDNVSTPFNGQAGINPVRSDSAIVIAEVNPNTPDEIEFVNVSAQAVDISGWVVSIYDADVWPNRKSFTIPAGTICAAGGIFRLQEFGTAPGAFPLFYFGSNINWTSDSAAPVAVLLSKADGTMTEFMCAASGNPALITAPSVIPPSQWTGGTISAPALNTQGYARQGNSDGNNAANWTTAAPGLGTLNPGLTIPFAGTAADLPVLPDTVSFTAGVWAGSLRVRAPATNLQLRAEDGASHRGDSNIFTVTSLGPLALSAAAGSYQENAGTIAGGLAVSLPAASASAVTVTVTSSDTSEAGSATITIPAGQLTAAAPLVIVNDTDLDGTQAVKLEASAPGYTPSIVSLVIHDDESAVISIAVPPAVSESAGILTGQGTVSVPAAVGADVRVALASSDTSEITVPAEVIIPSGQTSVSFDITVLQDPLLDGPQNATLTAAVVNWSLGTANIVVQDDEAAAITLSVDELTHEGVGTDPSIGVVTLGGVAVADVVVALTADDPAEIVIPGTVTIPAGQSSVSFPGTIVDDTDLDGSAGVTVAAAALGNWPVTDIITVRDNDAASFIFSIFPVIQTEGVPFTVSVLARDVAGLPLPAVAGPVTLTATSQSGPVTVQPSALSPFVNGIWTGSVRVMEPGTLVELVATGPSASSKSYAFYVYPGPRMEVSPSSFTLTIPRLSSKTRPLTITNTGVAPLTWSRSASSSSWITVAPAGGTVPVGGSQNVSAAFSAAALAEGAATGSLILTSNDAVRSPLSIPVNATISSPIASFAWDAVPSPQMVNTPFPVTITAKDAGGGTVAEFEGTVGLTGGIGGAGVSRTLLNSPAHTNTYNAGTYTLGYSFTPSSNLSVTALRSFSGSKVSIWSNTGVLLATVPVTAAAGSWSDTPLPTPLVLQAGVTYRVGFLSAGLPYYWRTSMSSVFSDGTILQSYEISGDGFPSTPSSGINWWFVDLKYTIGTAVAISPAASGAFASGVWSGNAAVQQTAAGLSLYANDGAGHTGASNAFDAQAVGTLGISLAASPVMENSGSLGGTVTVNPAPSADLAISLSSSVVTTAVPAAGTVTVPAGQTSAPFSLNIIDDALLDGPQTAQIGAVAPGYVSVSSALTVNDDEATDIVVSTPLDSYPEGNSAVTGTVTLEDPVVAAAVISLASSDATEATVPASITIPAGSSSATFLITIVNDTLVDGPQPVTITASGLLWNSGSKTLAITDNEARTLVLNGVPASISEGAAALGTASVSLSGQAVEPVTVTITSSDETAALSATATILAGSSSAVFAIDPVDDLLFDGTQNITLTASAATYANGSAPLAVLDDDAYSFDLSTVPSPQKEGAGFAFTATAKDINGTTITVPIGGPVNLTAAGDGGSVSVLPATLSPFASGVWAGNVRVMAPGTNVRLTVASPTAADQSNAFDVGMGPRLSVSPASLAATVPQDSAKTRPLTISNTGAEPLNWSVSAAMTGGGTPLLEAVLAGLNIRHAEITSLVPGRHDFTEGVTGASINDGGGHMYHSGNALRTNLSASFLNYSDNVITPAAASLGTGGRYFTRKVAGLFVFAADMSGAASFEISGGTGNHFGIVEGAVLTVSRGGKTYQGFVKRARGDSGAASVNHLVIIEQSGTAAHTFPAAVDSDIHTVSGLGGTGRIYHLLYSSQAGGLVDDSQTTAIFTKFLEVIGVQNWLSASPASGTLAPGASASAAAIFNAAGLGTGDYEGALNFASNDARQPLLPVPATMTVVPGVHHLDWDPVPSPQTVNAPFAATIRAKDAANNLVADFENSASLSALNTASAGEVTTGSGTSTTSLPVYTNYPISRSQMIYTAAEAGAAGRITGLALDISSIGSPAASNFTVRLKHTSRVNYASDTSWEGTGWTTVFTGSKSLALGWNYFTFTTPFDYDGSSNLMVDFSIVNGAYSSSSNCRGTSASPSRTVYYYGYSGDPLLWSGTSTTRLTSSIQPNLRLANSGIPASISPLSTEAFVNGVWSGNVRLGAAGTLEMTARLASGASGASNPVVTNGAAGVLSIAIPASLTEGQGFIANGGTITAAAAPAADVVVTLESLDTSEITFPATVTLPAGQTTASFDITVVDDPLLDGPVSVQARALAVGYPTATANSTVADNDTTTVTLTLPATLTEGTSSTAGQASVSLAHPAAANLTVALSSSLASRLTAPATIVIPAGQSSAAFTLTAPNNSIVDGNQDATITATLAGSPPASGVVQVVDNESRALTLVSSSTVSEGAAPLASNGYVYLSGAVTSPLTINLSSSDSSELTVPATVTIPAGSSQSGYFTLTPMNDALFDGSQTVTLTASAATFTNGTRTVTVTDDDAHHFTVSAVSSPQVRNGPFNVTFTAKDINNVTITAYAGSPALTANEGAASLVVTPTTVTGFSGGAKTQSVTVGTLAPAAVLTLTDAATGGSGSSNAFAVGAGSLHHFTWDTVPSPQLLNSPFPASLSARDVFENTVTTFAGPASLSAAKNYSATTAGAGTVSDWYPFGGYYPQNRCQMIYTPAEAGAAARRLRAIAFDMNTPNLSYPAVTLTSLSIRLKHTTKTNFSGTGNAVWDSTGWTTVFQGTVNMNQTGWRQLEFTTPFDYDGTSHLMVDVSSNNSTYFSRVESRYATQSSRTLYAFTSGQAAPATWVGTTPFPSVVSALPNLRLLSYDSVPMAPAQTGAFTGGAWAGQVSVQDAGSVTLLAGHSSLSGSSASNAFTVNLLGTLSISLPASAPESAGTVNGSVTVSAAPAADLTVNLASSDPGETAPALAAVIIPAGQTTAAFSANVTDDTDLDGGQPAVFTASSLGYQSGAASITIEDNETTTITLAASASLIENQGVVANGGTVTLGIAPTSPITVQLSSSDTSELIVPATVTVLAGSASASFNLIAVNDSIIDGPQPTVLTAHVGGWTDGTASVTVTDDEPRNLNLTAPLSAREGAAPVTATVSAGAAMGYDLTVSLASSDSDEAAVPAEAVIPAGQSSASFSITLGDDTIADGPQVAILSATASQFTASSRNFTVTDNDPHHLSFSTIPGTQIRNGQIPVTVTVQSIDGQTVTEFNSTASLSAAGSIGAMTVTPAATGAFTAGAWSGNVSLAEAATAAAISAQIAGGFTGSSNAFTVLAEGPPDSFEWSAIGSPQHVNVPVPVTITARDSAGNVATSFNEAAALEAYVPTGTGVRNIGTGGSTIEAPIHTGYHDCRSQQIYLASELGGAGAFTSLSLHMATAPPPVVLNNWTIRMKHTTRTAFGPSASDFIWETMGWTTVHQDNVTLSGFPGWITFNFTTPFHYDGTSNLLVDFSFNNNSKHSPTTFTYVTATSRGSGRRISYYTDSSYGDPLSWSGTSPISFTDSRVADLRLGSKIPVTMTPAATGAFVNGVWSGALTFSQAAEDVEAAASHSSGVSGRSGLFDVEVSQAVPLLAAEPAFTGGINNEIRWTIIPPGTEVSVQRDISPAFAAPTISPWSAAGAHTFEGLSDGTTYFYRAQSRQLGAAPQPQVWSQSSQAEFQTGSFQSTNALSSPGAVMLNTAGSAIESFEGPASDWSDTIFTQRAAATYTKGSALASMPVTTPRLPISDDADKEGEIAGSNVYALMAETPENTLTDGTVTVHVYSRNNITLNHAGIIARASGFGSTLNGYMARLHYNATAGSPIWMGVSKLVNGGQATLIAAGAGTSFDPATQHFKMQLSVIGSSIVARLWKVTVSGGLLTETLVDTRSGSDSGYTSGVCGLFVNTGAVFDDFVVQGSSYVSSGSFTSSPVSPASFNRWSVLSYSLTTPSGSSATVDILDPSGGLLIANAPSGADLNAYPLVANEASIRLKANFSALNSTVTPQLLDWSVQHVPPTPMTYSAWSSVVSSTQDATPPLLAVPAASTGASAVTLNGTAADAASGVASVLVAGNAVSTSNQFASWTAIVPGLVNGPNSFTVTASDLAVPPNTVAVSAMIFRIADPAGDSNGNGVSDLLEHALVVPAGDPNARSMLPAATVQADSGTGERFLTLEYRRRIQRAGLSYTVETTHDLITWTAAGGDVVEQSVVPVGDGVTETVRVRVTPAVDSIACKFVRLNVMIQ